MKNLTSPARLAVDATIAAGIVAGSLRHRRQLGLRRRELARAAHNQLLLASGLQPAKYVKFGKQIFMDSYAPAWPSRAFDALMRSFARGIDREREFIDYAIFAITNRCMFRCAHCYAIDMLQREETLSLGEILDTVRALKQIGVGVLSLEGGEPMLRFEELLQIIDAVAPETSPWIATTGYGLDSAKAHQLREAGLVGATISLDHWEPARHNAVRGSPRAFDLAVAAVRLLREAGVFPVIGVVASRELLAGDGLLRFLSFAGEVGAGMIQLLDPMPAGRYLNERGVHFQRHELQRLIDFQIAANSDPRYRDLPAVSARAFVEDEARFGCGMGGNQYLYIDASGNLQPCIYLNAAIGNLKQEGFWPAYQRMRRLFPRPVDGPCPVFSLHRAVAEAHQQGVPLPLPPEHTERICAGLQRRGLPRLLRKIQ